MPVELTDDVEVLREVVWPGGKPYGLVRLAGSDDSADGVLALIPTTGIKGGPIARQMSTPVPARLSQDSALLAPILAVALQMWEELQLEMGEAAIFTGEGPLAALLKLTASWHGANPVLHLARPTQSISPSPSASSEDGEPESIRKTLQGWRADLPGLAVVDLTGQANMIDLLLEVLPPYGRLMLAGPVSRPVIVDWYKNVHRKGARVLARHLEPAAMLGPAPGTASAARLRRAFAVMGNLELASAVRQVVGAQLDAMLRR